VSEIEPLRNLGGAAVTRALVLLSIFLFSTGPGLAQRVRLPELPELPGLKWEFDKNPMPPKGGRIDEPELRPSGKSQNSINGGNIIRDVAPPETNYERDCLVWTPDDCGTRERH
jgi:hypothetical protein